MIGRASAKDIRLLGGPGECFPGKILKFEILIWKCIEIINPTIAFLAPPGSNWQEQEQ